MRISMGFRKILWPTIVGIFNVAQISSGLIEVVALLSIAY
jgi:hypothetical protein